MVTIQDLLKGQQRGNGFGLYGHEVRGPAYWVESADPYGMVKLIDESVVEVANKFKMSAEDVFQFMDSRDGRHLGDVICNLTMKDVEHMGVVPRAIHNAIDAWRKRS